MRARLGLKLLCAVATLVAAGLAAAPSASASSLSFPLTFCDITGGCVTSPPYGTVTVTSLTTDEVSVTLSMNSGDFFAVGGAGQPLMFDLSTAGSYTVGTISDPEDSALGFTFNSDYSNPMHDDGSGYWTNWVSCTSGCSGGTSAKLLAGLTFDITGTTSNPITPASFIANATPLYFGTDVGIPNGTNSPNTGDVGAPTVVPLPPSLTLLGSALAALGLLWRRRERVLPARRR